MADHPLRPAIDRRLGRPLPHQLPNQTRANPSPINLSPEGRMRYYSQFPEAIPQRRAHSHALLTRPPLTRRCARLACIRPAASVRSEPGSNSQVETILTAEAAFLFLTFEPLHIVVPDRVDQGQFCLSCISLHRKPKPPNSEADTPSSSRSPRSVTCEVRRSYDQAARISLQILAISKSGDKIDRRRPTLVWRNPLQLPQMCPSGPPKRSLRRSVGVAVAPQRRR